MDTERPKRYAEIQWALDPMTDEELTKKAEEVQMKLDAMRPEDLLKKRAELQKVLDGAHQLTEEDIDSYLGEKSPEELELFLEQMFEQFRLFVRWERIHCRREGLDGSQSENSPE